MVIINLLTAIATRVLILVDGLVALARLAAVAFSCRSGEGSFKQRITARLTAPDGLRLVLGAVRSLLPNLVVSRKFATAYDNGGSALVTRFTDVQEVLNRDDDFEVVYGSRMATITGGPNFFLGMADSPTYTRDVSNMRLAVRRSDVPGMVAPFVSTEAAALVAAAPGRIDVPQDLTLKVPARLLGAYFGTPGSSEQAMIDWTTTMFWYLFIDLNADPAFDARAAIAAEGCRAYLDQTIAARKAAPLDQDDVLQRCLAMQAAGLPGMDDLGIRNYLIGLMIGLVPTTSRASVQALDQLLDRPDALAGAQRAALADDDDLLGRYVFEALRFNPVNPVIYRRAVRDTVIARNTLRARTIPRATMVYAANLSAMFDRLQLPEPDSFRVDRPWEDYILWGYGLHTCFGAHINRIAIPALLKPLLKQRGLRRADGLAGRIDTAGTPFPVHLMLEFDRA
ncbi:MAG TPA: cytochrome P450 [Aliidongia sp.]|uniref:cytochrome P450 n=1 Tax=Aliidongia sp. TaxID=1914230 RepID=UPI002DDDB30B|nr:cytochrome P450 [Aliidongia sp.]HEV2674804.1 cytochrome P450 [Aliidongia sp.]